MTLRYGSVCSGIEAATLAWHSLGWRASFYSEIDKFPRAVLQQRFPDVPLHGDFTTIQAGEYDPIDILIGGTPCQDFSVAGLRKGFDGDRGNLTFEFVHLAERLRPRWIVWENVPGCLSIDGGRGFGTFLGMLGKLGYGTAYRILDAQYAGLAQRRERVFVVGCLGDWRRAAAVLFERESLRWDPAPRREAGKGSTHALAPSLTGSGRGVERSGESRGQDPVIPVAFGGNNTSGPIDVGTALRAKGGSGHGDFESETFVATAFKASHFTRGKDGAPRTTAEPLSADADKGDQDTLVCAPVAFNGRQDPCPGAIAQPVDTDAFTQCIAFSVKDHGADAASDLSPTLRAGGHDKSHANGGVGPAVAIPLQEVGKRTGKSTDDVRAGIGIGIGIDGDPMFTLQSSAQHGVALAFEPRFVRNGRGAPDDITSPLKAESGRTGKGDGATCVATVAAVRRLMPVECCRLQGVPDDHLDIEYRGKPAADGPKYKALGNSFPVPVIHWIGKRIQMVEDMS